MKTAANDLAIRRKEDDQNAVALLKPIRQRDNAHRDLFATVRTTPGPTPTLKSKNSPAKSPNRRSICDACVVPGINSYPIP
jgi:hypothetical protein